MIRLSGVNFKQGNFLLKDISVEINNEYTVLIGPPGAGKTTLLEVLCGLRKVESGEIVLNGTDITKLLPGQRGIGYMPQDYALFPHLTVRNNIGFGLKILKHEKVYIEKKIKEICELLEITELLDREPKSLSGGEGQRVAMARALVISPKLLLLDEPLCALDEKTRAKLIGVLKKTQKQMKIPFLHVCHFYDEMERLSEQALVMWNGELVQNGKLKDIRKKPANKNIAEFICKGDYVCEK